jgi:hypothetical protein
LKSLKLELQDDDVEDVVEVFPLVVVEQPTRNMEGEVRVNELEVHLGNNQKLFIEHVFTSFNHV